MRSVSHSIVGCVYQGTAPPVYRVALAYRSMPAFVAHLGEKLKRKVKFAKSDRHASQALKYDVGGVFQRGGIGAGRFAHHASTS
jgi:hypothetical protein